MKNWKKMYIGMEEESIIVNFIINLVKLLVILLPIVMTILKKRALFVVNAKVYKLFNYFKNLGNPDCTEVINCSIPKFKEKVPKWTKEGDTLHHPKHPSRNPFLTTAPATGHWQNFGPSINKQTINLSAGHRPGSFVGPSEPRGGGKSLLGQTSV